jgi:triacylglycerol lipase
VTPMFSTTAGISAGQVGMTLAAIAYQPTSDAISALLANATLSTQGRWSLVWYGVDDANQAYIALDNQSGQYAIAIRGSVTDPFTPAFWSDWFVQDASVFRQADWPYGGAPSGASISQGTLHGLGSLLSLTDDKNDTLVDFYRSIPQPAYLTAIVGHSLGGALASALAPYMHQEFSPGKDVLDFWPVTFAAPTAGDGGFASWQELQFAASAGRYFNTLDVIPHAWNGLDWVASSFQGGPSLPETLKLPVQTIRDFLKLTRADYQQPGVGNPLPGALVGSVDWIGEAGAQHGSATYLSLLGAVPIPG